MTADRRVARGQFANGFRPAPLKAMMFIQINGESVRPVDCQSIGVGNREETDHE